MNKTDRFHSWLQRLKQSIHKPKHVRDDKKNLVQTLARKPGDPLLQSLALGDEFVAIHRNKHGKVLDYYVSRGHRHKSIVNVGLPLAASLLGGLGAAAFTYVGIGTGTTGVQITDTKLEVQISRLNCTPTRVNTTVTNDTLQQDVIFSHATDAGLTGTAVAVTETGVFDASGTTDNAMLWRQTFGAMTMNWDGGDSLEMITKTQMKQGS
jgi:hypothetical protein